MSQPDDDALKRFAAAITLARAEFEQIYDDLALARAARPFKITALLSPPDLPFLNALQTARDGGWFDELALRLTAVDAFKAAADDAAVPADLRVELQAIVQPDLGMIPMGDLSKGSICAVKRVCRVELLDGSGVTGTGFLVGPQAILTARHVVAGLLAADGAPLPGSDMRLQVVFGDVGRVAKLRICGVSAEWLIGSSECHASEAPEAQYSTLAGAPPDSFKDCLDYAILRLDAPVGQARGYYVLDARREPVIGDAGANLSLFQHPMGGGMHMAVGSGLALWPDAIRTRLRHSANSLPGTSGGLIVDRSFEPVAMHQCGYIDDDGVARVNGAIPTARIAARQDNVAAVVGLDPLRRIAANAHPVIGRRGFQDHVMSLMTGERRLLVVRGQEDSGKSFSIQILRTMLDESSHIVVEHDASAISIDAPTFAQNLLRTMLGADARPDDLPPLADTDTALEAWLRDLLLPALVRRLGEHAGDRTLWLVIDDLDRHPLAPGTSTTSLLERLFAEIQTIPFLRIVLIGQQGRPFGAAFNQLAEDNISELSQGELEEYINLRFVAKGVNKSLEDVEALAASYMNIARTLPSPFLPALLMTVSSGLQPIDGGDQ
jgi:hypothetical protein